MSDELITLDNSKMNSQYLTQRYSQAYLGYPKPKIHYELLFFINIINIRNN